MRFSTILLAFFALPVAAVPLTELVAQRDELLSEKNLLEIGQQDDLLARWLTAQKRITDNLAEAIQKDALRADSLAGDYQFLLSQYRTEIDNFRKIPAFNRKNALGETSPIVPFSFPKAVIGLATILKDQARISISMMWSIFSFLGKMERNSLSPSHWRFPFKYPPRMMSVLKISVSRLQNGLLRQVSSKSKSLMTRFVAKSTTAWQIRLTTCSKPANSKG